MYKIAVIAGEGILPLEIVRKLFSRDIKILVLSLSNNKNIASFKNYSDKIIILKTPALGRAIHEIKSWGANSLIMAGKIPKKLIFLLSSIICDPITRKVIKNSLHDDHSILDAVVYEFESNGIKVIPYCNIIPEFLAPKGKLTSRFPTQNEFNDLIYGRKILKRTLPCSFGQSIVISNGAVVAIEAMEGTDEMIKRAGNLIHSGVLVKMMKKSQDVRYDLPVTGTTTLENMKNSGLTCLAVEASKTIILEPQKFFDLAEKYNISVWGM